MVEFVPDPAKFPKLAVQTGGHTTTSSPTRKYNCIAWAADIDRRWAWPVPGSGGWWPPDVPRGLQILPTFEMFYGKYGYIKCDSPAYEPGFDKVAIFVLSGFVKHAAKQLQNGLWTSKMGGDCDITHSLGDLVGPFYGDIARYMRRPYNPGP